MTEAFTRFDSPPAGPIEVMVVALSGWIDASGAAQAALEELEDQLGLRLVATFDEDTFIDYRARRPTLVVRDGLSERLVWNAPELRHGTDRDGRGVLVLSGPEPDANWQRFAQAVADLACEFGVRRMVGLGAYPFATPHTRATKLACTTPSAALLAEVPYQRSTVEVPAGMQAVLERILFDRGVQTIGIWAQVPHYVSAMAYPAASAALLDALTELTTLAIDPAKLRQQAVIQRQRLDGLVAANAEHERMVVQLEEAWDLANETGDELVAELEKFLRDGDQGS